MLLKIIQTIFVKYSKTTLKLKLKFTYFNFMYLVLSTCMYRRIVVLLLKDVVRKIFKIIVAKTKEH